MLNRNSFKNSDGGGCESTGVQMSISQRPLLSKATTTEAEVVQTEFQEEI